MIKDRSKQRYGLKNLPEDWEITLIDNVATRKSGHTPNKKIGEYWNGTIPWVSLKDIYKFNQKYVYDTTDNTTCEGINNSSAVLLPKGTIMISRDATIGKMAIAGQEMATSQHFINYICGPKLNNVYLYYNLLYRDYIFEKFAVGSTIKTIGLNFFKNLIIALPPIEEQQKIAEILSTWDKAIELKEQLIEQKKERKNGLMQKLLTGEMRVSGFDGEWKEIRLGDIGFCIRGVSYKPGDLYSEESTNTCRLLRSNNIFENKVLYSDIQYVDKVKVKEKQILKENDIIISMANGSKKLVGKNVEYKHASNQSYTVGAFCSIFRSKKNVSSRLIKYLFKTSKYDYYVSILIAGSNINNLKPSDIESMKFFVPSDLEEQNKIAETLGICDKEIFYLEEELRHIKLQKRGLMQLLLTGKVRVKV
ncbi:restriction endonuclease subunit S [Alkalibacillus salilacus]|uniref:Type I restriction enzyme S subunit n=1 Tax=Alkalibacillus salilacus TaxID=284582 RepID=A0ABT9VIF2_9BACI|nr:restriction endonuclease subunit S [Alkalibacillus salilacus]MDQ0160741.1 type I restriction enzyme S subunit [Alkalibacillus salilacus]